MSSSNVIYRLFILYSPRFQGVSDYIILSTLFLKFALLSILKYAFERKFSLKGNFLLSIFKLKEYLRENNLRGRALVEGLLHPLVSAPFLQFKIALVLVFDFFCYLTN
jgi:hypothetical protein